MRDYKLVDLVWFVTGWTTMSVSVFEVSQQKPDSYGLLLCQATAVAGGLMAAMAMVMMSRQGKKGEK